MSKLAKMEDGMSRLIYDGDTVVREGFTHLIPFTVGHELIRLRPKDVTLVRLTPDLLFEQIASPLRETEPPSAKELHVLRDELATAGGAS